MAQFNNINLTFTKANSRWVMIRVCKSIRTNGIQDMDSGVLVHRQCYTVKQLPVFLFVLAYDFPLRVIWISVDVPTISEHFRRLQKMALGFLEKLTVAHMTCDIYWSILSKLNQSLHPVWAKSS